MQMEDRLLGRLAGRGDQVHALGRHRPLDSPADADDGPHQIGPELRVDGPKVPNMGPGDDQSVAGGRWLGGEKRHPGFSLTNDVSRLVLLSDDRAKGAILVVIDSRRQSGNSLG